MSLQQETVQTLVPAQRALNDTSSLLLSCASKGSWQRIMLSQESPDSPSSWPLWGTLLHKLPPMCDETSFYKSILWPKNGMQHRGFGNKQRQIKEERFFTAMISNWCFPSGPWGLSLLFLEEWGREELVPFVAKRPKLSQVRFTAIENQWQGGYCEAGRSLCFKMPGPPL
jgi:hypothetical protein